MNARLYDPVLGRMISPDNFVNGVFASQAYNRYSYANNNPLKYTDPSGNHPVLIAMAIAAAINIGYQVMYNEGFDNFSVKSLVLATLQGGISAGMAGIIGNFLEPLTGFTKLAAGIALHGLSGGIQSAVFGGDIGQGILSGMIGHGVGELFVGAGISQNMGLLGNFVVGGMSSALVATAMGNDPMQAFIIGGATAAFNSFMHDKPKPKKYRVINTSHDALDIYNNGNGAPAVISEETTLELRNSKEYQRVIQRLKSGTAKKTSSSFDVDLTWSSFYIGDTNVDYQTICDQSNCRTYFYEFVRDGFWDPNIISLSPTDGKGPNNGFGGTVYDFVPSKNGITYPNPGYKYIPNFNLKKP